MQHGAGLNEIALAFVNTTSRSYFGKMNSTLRCAFGNVSIYPSSGQCIVTVFHMSINILMLETVSEGVVIAHIPAATHISFIRRPSSKMLLVKNPFFF